MSNQIELIEYSWWGGDNEPPSNLKTQKQLAELKLKPLRAIGVIHTKKYDLFLYDVDDPASATPKKKATESQLKALEKGRLKQREKSLKYHWRNDVGFHLENRNQAIEWAKAIIKKGDYLIIDTETTGFYDAEIVQIGIINLDKEIILDSLIKPTIPIPSEVINIHGIDDNKVKNAPTFKEIYPQLNDILEGKNVLIHNAGFDTSIINYCCTLNNLKMISFESKCLMEMYAEYWGEWSEYHESYRWQKLGGDHSAIGDCLAALKMLEEMADSTLINIDEALENYLKENL